MVENRGTRLLILLSLMILLINFTSAEIPKLSTTFDDSPTILGTYAKNSSIQLLFICDNCTYVNITSVSFPNSTLLLQGQNPMTKNGSVYNFPFSAANTLGDYLYVACGDLNGVLTCGNAQFQINALGDNLTTSKSILYSFLIFIFLLLDFIIFYVIYCLSPGNYYKDGHTGEIYSAKHKRTEFDSPIGVSLKKYFRVVLIGISYGFILLTLNLLLATANNLTLSQFAGIIGFVFMIMLKLGWIWTLFIVFWIGKMVYDDSDFVQFIELNLEEEKYG